MTNNDLVKKTLLNAHRICREKRYVYLSELEEKEDKMPNAIFSIMQYPDAREIFSAGADSHGTYYYMNDVYAAKNPSDVTAAIYAIAEVGLKDMGKYLNMTEEERYEIYKRNRASRERRMSR